VRITKDNLKFSKWYEQSFSTEMFKVVKVSQRVPQRGYEISDLQDRGIEGKL